MPSYKSVDITRLRAAFSLAHRASEDLTIPPSSRKQFKAIAHLLWDACGEEKKLPPGAGYTLSDLPEVRAEVIAALMQS